MTALICVVSYNNLALTQRAVDHLRNQSYPTRIAVWDNASMDGTAEWLDKQHDIEKVCSDQNVFWTPAVNRLMSSFWQDEEYVGYMNNDAAPLRHTVERLVKLLEREEVGLVAPSMERIGGPQDIANCQGHDYVKEGGFVERALEGLPPKRVNYVLGAFAMLRKPVWDEIGPLAEDMPLGADDHDFCIRMKDKGYQIWVAQEAFCLHAGHASANSKTAERNWDDVGAKSWDAFNKKWAGYFATEEEAINTHWGGDYVEGFDRGTGWGDTSGVTESSTSSS
jgi:GT2 family glycosyltransferase